MVNKVAIPDLRLSSTLPKTNMNSLLDQPWYQSGTKSYSPSHFRLWGRLGNDDRLPKLGLQVHLVIPVPKKLPLDGLHWFS